MLPPAPIVSRPWRSRLERVTASTRSAPPAHLAHLIAEELGIDLSARYAGISVPHPFGKASGQLSCKRSQVEADVAAGVAFVVLKTVIAETAAGERSMEAWTVPETRMTLQRRTAPDGRPGWTVTWEGRGWTDTLAEYLEFFEDACDLGRAEDVPIIPSVKYHLPVGEEPFRVDEYRDTTQRLLRSWDRVGCGGPMVLEKDFSPTLAGDDRARHRSRVLSWLESVPGLITQIAPARIRLGVKMMNALFDDAFQVEMVRSVLRGDHPVPDFLVVFNRLFDPIRRVAFGGWELSDRNLRVLDALHNAGVSLPPLSATGNICSGRMMVEYALRGCENGQVHTFFQVPLAEYTARGGSRSARALHTLMLHPTEGIAVWLRHLHECGRLAARGGRVRFLDVCDGARAAASP